MHKIVDISPCAASNLCCAASGSSYLLCLLYVHVVYDDKHVLMRARVCVCVCGGGGGVTPDLTIFKNIILYSHYQLLFLGFLTSISTWFV